MCLCARRCSYSFKISVPIRVQSPSTPSAGVQPAAPAPAAAALPVLPPASTSEVAVCVLSASAGVYTARAQVKDSEELPDAAAAAEAAPAAAAGRRKPLGLSLPPQAELAAKSVRVVSAPPLLVLLRAWSARVRRAGCWPVCAPRQRIQYRARRECARHVAVSVLHGEQRAGCAAGMRIPRVNRAGQSMVPHGGARRRPCCARAAAAFAFLALRSFSLCLGWRAPLAAAAAAAPLPLTGGGASAR